MRTLVLMVLFGFGSLLLLPRTARSLDDCKACDCRVMKAWLPINVADLKNAPQGLRGPDPMNSEKTVPIEHVPALDTSGRYLAAACDTGTRTATDTSKVPTTYPLYKYHALPDIDCKWDPKENGNSNVRVTFAKAEMWDVFTELNLAKQRQYRCE